MFTYDMYSVIIRVTTKTISLTEKLFNRKTTIMQQKPLTHHLNSFIKNNPSPFHTPGHKGRWGELFGSRFAGFDIFRADIADDIDGIPGKIRESEETAAEFFGTLRSLYLVSGSTGGIHTMFLSVLKPGDEVLAGRNMHRSAIEGAILAGVIPRYVPCRMTEEGIPLNVTPADIENALQEYPHCKAVHITSPSYFGVCADVEAISEICVRKGKFLLVDEAWGGHFPFHPDFPDSAIQSGADLVVQSLHKTLPSLTGSSILHICSDKIDINAVESAKSLVETSSPNLLFYLSLENAINLMKEKGVEIYGRAVENADFCRKEMKRIATGLPLWILDGREFKLKYDDISGDAHPDSLITFPADPLKLTIWMDSPDKNFTGPEIARILEEEYGVCAEMAHLNAVQFLFTGFERDEDAGRLVSSFERVLEEITNTGSRVAPAPGGNTSEKAMQGAGAPCYPKRKLHIEKSRTALNLMKMPPREAYFSQKETLPLWQSEGSICGEIVTPYPPGIPLLIPGEEITGEIIEHLLETLEAGGCVKGLDYRGDEPAVVVVK